MVSFVPRLIGQRLLRSPEAPVLILEGARAVGKSTMMREQLQNARGYDYVSFADEPTLQRAQSDLSGWLRRFPRPTIIDEAQLVPKLPLALKEHTDALSTTNQFILTGSATIGRTGLGGADPLTRRAQRMTMHPLTRWELEGNTGSVVDLLFDGRPRIGSFPQRSDADLLDQFRVGGFPLYLFPRTLLTRGGIRDRLASDLTMILSDEVMPDLGFNVMKARAVLDALLRRPGGILNATDLGRQLDLDKRTIERHVDAFSRLFLIQWLPNLATEGRKQSFARAKIHASDTAFAVDATERAGIDILDQREYFGQLLESHVVGEILAHSQWATTRTLAHYWRKASSTNPEVDLVLTDDLGRQVAIEVKAARSVSVSDLTGIRAFRAARGLHRGFVFYRGDDIIALEDNIWAVPISTLEAASSFDAAPDIKMITDREEPIIVNSPAVVESRADFDASIFISYVHADDEAQKGRITKFARDLAATYSFLYGRDLQVFIDRDDIQWGQDWRARLGHEIAATAFMLANVTPRYLRSAACRQEILDFATAARAVGEPSLLLPLIWVDIDGTDVVPKDDPVRQRILASQYVDVTAIRGVEPDSLEYEQFVERVAARLRSTLVARASSTHDDAPGEDAPDLFDLVAAMNNHREMLDSAVADFAGAFDEIGSALRAEALPQIADTHAASAAFARIGGRLEGPSAKLISATESLGTAWGLIDGDISEFVKFSSSMPSDVRNEIGESLVGLSRALEQPGLEQMDTVVTMMSGISRQLRPTGRALGGALQLVRGISDSARAWRAALLPGADDQSSKEP
ncbi:DUF4143 domain-containing protein [Microbacterium sp. PMB16]|uniref:DUF4143 domain-containing protein n=1 Tax=Microbacterium sp. PMB16 TaxID=3120157 RepID=UPI003F4B9509